MVVWQVLIIVLGSFSIAFFAAMAVMNVIVIFFAQEKLAIDPINYAFLSIIFPVCKLPTAKVESESALQLLFYLLIAGNAFLVSAYSIVYSLYYFDVYNPWCKEDMSMLLLPEDWFSRSFFLVSSTNFFIIYLYQISNKTRACFRRFQDCPPVKDLLEHLLGHLQGNLL
jgi:hypothetical protein